MAKKKQLAGKETKLAKLPLTRALAGQQPEADWEPGEKNLAADAIPSSPAAMGTETALTPLAEVYLYLLQELTDLNVFLNPSPNPSQTQKQDSPLWQLPDPLLIELALWRARQGLRELQALLSHS